MLVASLPGLPRGSGTCERVSHSCSLYSGDFGNASNSKDDFRIMCKSSKVPHMKNDKRVYPIIKKAHNNKNVMPTFQHPDGSLPTPFLLALRLLLLRLTKIFLTLHILEIQNTSFPLIREQGGRDWDTILSLAEESPKTSQDLR